MIWGVGLPRCAGQTLQEAIHILTGRQVWHSIEAHRWGDSLSSEDAGAVELYAPTKWLADYPGGPHLFINNTRDKESWLASCTKVYQQSQEENWNHPIWRYPLDQFADYYDDWNERLRRSSIPVKTVNIVADPSWERLCKILEVPVPNQPFPNQDKTRDRKSVV